MSSTSPRHKLPYHHHHHVMRHKAQPVPTREPALLDQALVDKLLIDGIKTICEEEAWKQNITDPSIESVALESLAAAMEEFMLKFLSMARRSMLAARRTMPTATDFEAAIDALEVPRPDDQLRPYQTHTSTVPSLLPTPPPEDEFHNTTKLPPSLLGPELDSHGGLTKFAFSVGGIPELPSAHTFKETPVYPHRETDSRRIRELATQEGKLGEQALRKLAGAVKLDAAHPPAAAAAAAESQPPPNRRPKVFQSKQRKRWKSGIDVPEEAVFEETLRDLLAKEPGGFELGPIVTCEKAYRMPDDAQVKRRAHPVNGTASTGPARSLTGPASNGPDAMVF